MSFPMSLRSQVTISDDERVESVGVQSAAREAAKPADSQAPLTYPAFGLSVSGASSDPGHWIDVEGTRWCYHPQDKGHYPRWNKLLPRGRKGPKVRVPVDPKKPAIEQPRAPLWVRVGQYPPVPAPQNVRKWQVGIAAGGAVPAGRAIILVTEGAAAPIVLAPAL